MAAIGEGPEKSELSKLHGNHPEFVEILPKLCSKEKPRKIWEAHKCTVMLQGSKETPPQQYQTQDNKQCGKGLNLKGVSAPIV